jgi:hypothetical protein
MVGTSPFASAAPTPTPGPSETSDAAGPSDFSDDTPAAPPEQREEARLSTAGEELEAYSPATPQMDRGIPQPHRLPVTKSSAGPLLLMGVLLLAIVAAVAFLMMKKGGGDEPEGEPEKSDVSTKDAE